LTERPCGFSPSKNSADCVLRAPLPVLAPTLVALMGTSEYLVDLASTVLVGCLRYGLVVHTTDLCGLRVAE